MPTKNIRPNVVFDLIDPSTHRPIDDQAWVYYS